MAQTGQLENDFITELKAAFDFYGAQNDKLTRRELRTILNKMNLPSSDQDVEKMMKEGDLADAGYIDFAAFVTLMTKDQEGFGNETTLKLAFEIFDPKKTGKIDKDELGSYLKTRGNKLTQDEWKQIEKIADPNSEGTFNYHLVLKEIFGSKDKSA